MHDESFDQQRDGIYIFLVLSFDFNAICGVVLLKVIQLEPRKCNEGSSV